MKMDIEGLKWHALNVGVGLLDRTNVDFCYFEVNQRALFSVELLLTLCLGSSNLEDTIFSGPILQTVGYSRGWFRCRGRIQGFTNWGMMPNFGVGDLNPSFSWRR